MHNDTLWMPFKYCIAIFMPEICVRKKKQQEEGIALECESHIHSLRYQIQELFYSSFSVMKIEVRFMTSRPRNEFAINSQIAELIRNCTEIWNRIKHFVMFMSIFAQIEPIT